MDYEKGLAFLGNLDDVAKKGGKWMADRKPIRNIRDWAINFSLWPVHLTTACCGCEFAPTAAPRYDSERLGVLPWIGARQTNVLIVEGTLTRKMAKAAKIVHSQMPEPKYVMAMGACASDGGIFWNSYNIVRPKEILPIEVYIPGCPPRPEAVIRGFMKLKEKTRKELEFQETSGGESS
ncbi:NADH dehydrogenase [candidate division MSBL1 archaeon SCGC-AAA259M10]|uniref:NADH dehydrogenase n=1 Tax=candidate division MSBL1 archaeon SCGC-AAA259M10 TaxID=1698270 RepID=A0A133V046_9EURY|nr:NADH dehydrogenase [candidate division MSBL1 archaeon SCGC-AAA259M10]